MGTRSLIAVVKNSQYKVAQYSQWDGYIEGQGATVLKFISNSDNIVKLNNSLIKTRFIDADGADKQFIEEYDKNCPEFIGENDTRTDAQIRWFNTYISRDIGARILENIISSQDAEILLQNRIEFAKNPNSWCEYVYVVDLDKNIFQIYIGNLTCDVAKEYTLNNLPSQEQFFLDFGIE